MTMRTVEYAPDRLADLYGEPAQQTVLMWHGAQTNARSTVRPLAERVAGHRIGVADDVVPVTVSRVFASTLRENAWPVEVSELTTDHGGIAGATYDPAADRYSAADDPQTLAVAADVAARIAAVVAR